MKWKWKIRRETDLLPSLAYVAVVQLLLVVVVVKRLVVCVYTVATLQTLIVVTVVMVVETLKFNGDFALPPAESVLFVL